jgi:hypothetical protein
MDKNKALKKYQERQELSQASLVDTMAVIKKMVDAGAIEKTPTKMIVTRGMFEAAQRIVLNGNTNKHEIEVKFDE